MKEILYSKLRLKLSKLWENPFKRMYSISLAYPIDIGI